MFDVGFSELLIIAVVALLVLGPERLPKAARFAGLWVRKARAQWYSVKSELELELAQEEMKQHLQDAENSIKAPMQELQHDLQQAETGISRDFDSLADAVKAEPEPIAALPEQPESLASHNNAEPDSIETTDPTPKPAQGALW